MAIDTEAARMLLAAARSGVSFASTVTLGRQSYLPGARETRDLLKLAGITADRFPALLGEYAPGRYAEPFFEALGSRRLESIDACDFERATLIHDLNRPIPEAWRGQFDIVYDGGTIEHVFSFQTAIQNCMELARVGGRVMLHTPANNYFGHGFFQFSPELFYRVFSAAHGFTVERMIAMEYGPRRRWFEVRDPAAIRARTPLINPFPVLLFVQARKDSARPFLQATLQQSDYATMWDQTVTNPQAEQAPPRGVVDRVKRTLVERLPRLARVLEALVFSQLNQGFSFRNRTAFRRIEKASLFR